MTTKMRGDQLDAGTGANQMVQLDGTGALPAVDGSNLTGISGGGGGSPPGLQAVVDDTTPQLGGNLDVNGNDITSAPAAAVGAGGVLDIIAAAGGVTSGNGGAINITGGLGTTAGSGGVVTITGGTASSGGFAGGDVALVGGDGSNAPGDITLTPGLFSTTPGHVEIRTPIGGTQTPQLRFYDEDNSHYVGFRAPDPLASSTFYILPVDTATDGDVLTWNTGQQLSWEAPAAGGSGVFTELGNGTIHGGNGAGASITAGSPTVGGVHNFLAGTAAGSLITTGGYNIAIGINSLASITTDTAMIAIGKDAGRYADGAVVGAEGVILIGENAGAGTASNDSTNMRYDIAIGYNAMQHNRSSGQRNVAIGVDALRGNTSTGSTGVALNVAIGSQAAHDIETGDFNVVIGGTAGYSLSDGSRNVIIGHAGGFNVTTGTDNIIIGRSAGPSTNVSNQLFIDSIQAASDTPLIHGNFSTEEVTINGDITITGDIFSGGFGSPAVTPVQIGFDLGEYTVANLPSAITNANCWALATNASGGRTIVRSDGTNWKVVVVEGIDVTT